MCFERVDELFSKYDIQTTWNISYYYPIKFSAYRRVVGDILCDVVKFILENKGFRVDIKWAYMNGLDLKAYWNNKLLIVGEIFNVWKNSYILPKRARGYIRELSSHDCYKVIICSLDHRLKEWFESIKEIDMICLGYQLLPKQFYEFFRRQGRVDMRKPLTIDTLMEIDRLITDYLEDKMLVVTIEE